MTRLHRKPLVRRMRGARAILAATALAVAAGLAQPASAASADSPRYTPAAQRLDNGRDSDARLKAVHERRLEERRKAQRERRDWKRHERRVRTLDRHDVAKVLHRRGYRKVHDVRRVGRVYRARAIGRHGRPVGVIVNARTGRIMGVERLHWPRPVYRW